MGVAAPVLGKRVEREMAGEGMVGYGLCLDGGVSGGFSRVREKKAKSFLGFFSLWCCLPFNCKIATLAKMTPPL